MPRVDSATTLLRKPWLNLARFIWIVISLASVLVFIFGGIKIIQDPLPACTVPGAVCGPWLISQEDITLAQRIGSPVQLMFFLYYLNGILPKLFFILVGVLIFWRRSDDWIALLLALMLTTFVTEGVTGLGSFTLVAALLYAVATFSFILLPFVFPNGRIEPSWMRWIVPIVVLGSIVTSSLQYINAGISEAFFNLVLLGFFLIWFVFGGYAFLYKYRRVSSPVERQQTKWVILGILSQIILFIPFTIIALAYPPSQPSSARLVFFYWVYLPIGLLSYFFLPGSIAIAILRYRLYDIDLIIRRTLQYSLLSGLLVLVYFGGVALLSAIGGQTSPVVIVLTTLFIAALFNPLRMRIQAFIDRRFYRQKYDTEKALADFATAARSETDLEQLSEHLTSTVQETLQPEQVSLWLQANHQSTGEVR